MTNQGIFRAKKKGLSPFLLQVSHHPVGQLVHTLGSDDDVVHGRNFLHQFNRGSEGEPASRSVAKVLTDQGLHGAESSGVHHCCVPSFFYVCWLLTNYIHYNRSRQICQYLFELFLKKIFKIEQEEASCSKVCINPPPLPNMPSPRPPACPRLYPNYTA